MSSAGQSTFRSRFFLVFTSTMLTFRSDPSSWPTRNCATASMGARVADRPILVSLFWRYWAKRSNVKERKTPRLESQISWISSTITYSTDENFSRNFGAANARANDSGVVIKI